MQALEASTRFEFVFFGSDKDYEGIKTVDPRTVHRFRSSPFRRFAGLFWQSAALREALCREHRAIIFLGNPNFISTWIGAALARLFGKKVLFWAHGWLRPEPQWKSLVRNSFFRLAHLVLVYGNRARLLARDSGFPENRVKAIYNSLDYASAQQVISEIRASASDRISAQDLFETAAPVVICTARLTRLCELNLLLDAARLLQDRGRPINILLVGDGPEREALAMQAGRLGINVHFFGACYDERILGQLIYSSDLMAQPGKMGLTVIHSLMYGTPAITHSDMDRQMPEAESIVEGQTGVFFRREDVRDLADKIDQWLNSGRDREVVRVACFSVIEEKWNPMIQKQLIEDALEALISAKPS